MISVRSTISPAGQLVLGGRGEIPDTPWFSPVEYYTIPVLCSPYKNQTFSEYVVEVPFGHLSQGTRTWGRLRDKDVYHVHAAGEVTLDPLSVTALDYTPGPDGNYVYGLTFVEGSVTRYASRVIPWGHSTSWSESYEPGMGSSSEHGAVVSYTNHLAYYTVQFNGHLAYEACRFVAGTVEFADGYTHTPDVRVVYSRVVKRYSTSSNTLWSFQYRDCTEVDSHRVMTPKGDVYEWDAVPLDLTYWLPYAVYTQSWEHMSTWGVDGSEDVLGLCTALALELEEQIPLSRIIRYFTDNPCSYDARELCQDILDQHKLVDANILQTLYELIALFAGNPEALTTLFSRVTGAMDVMKAGGLLSEGLSKAKYFAKLWSDLELTLQYGILPTLGDMQKIWDAYFSALSSKESISRLHSRHETNDDGPTGSLVTTDVLTVEVGRLPEDFLSVPTHVVRGLWSVGLWPNFTMAYDVIPFSFMVDWFKNIGQLAERADLAIWTEYFPIQYCIVSRKRAWTVAVQDLIPVEGIVLGDITFFVYQRYCDRELPLPPIEVGGNNGSFSHWAEASALVVQRLR